MKAFHLQSNEKKSGKDLNKIEARFCLKEVEMNSLKIKLQRC